MKRAFLLPVVFVTYGLAYLDRANFGFGAAAGLAQTLHITDKQTALLGAFFFLGYFAFQVPGMLLTRRVSPSKLVFCMLLIWGSLAALTGVVKTYTTLAIVRFLLGVSESVIFPAMLLLLTRWFTRAERSRSNTILLLGNPVTVLWMSIITGFLIQRFGWQITFIIEGLPAVVWAFCWVLLMKDRPTDAPWMDPADARALEAEIAAQRPVLASDDSEGQRLVKVLLSGRVLLISLQYFLWSIGVYGFVLWLPAIVRRGAALSMGSTGLLSAVPYVSAIALMLFVSQGSDRTMLRLPYIWPLLFVAGAAMLGSFASGSFAVSFGCLMIAAATMYAPYGPFFALLPEYVPKHLTGETFAMVNASGALGGFVGSYAVGALTAATGNHRAGDLLLSLSLIAAAGLTLLFPKVESPSANVTVQHA